MILSRITSKAQTTIPRAVRAALGLGVGDQLAWSIEDGEVRLQRVSTSQSDRQLDTFSSFTEWADELDSAYDNL